MFVLGAVRVFQCRLHHLASGGMALTDIPKRGMLLSREKRLSVNQMGRGWACSRVMRSILADQAATGVMFIFD